MPFADSSPIPDRLCVVDKIIKILRFLSTINRDPFTPETARIGRFIAK
jgi:hypothetical protein